MSVWPTQTEQPHSHETWSGLPVASPSAQPPPAANDDGPVTWFERGPGLLTALIVCELVALLAWGAVELVERVWGRL